MAFYRYKVLQNGKLTETTVEASSETEAANGLFRRNVTIIKLLETSSSQKGERRSVFRLFDRGRFNVYVFTERLAPLLKANIPLEQSLAVIEEGMTRAIRNLCCAGIAPGIAGRQKVFRAGPARSATFPPLYPSLIETGEQTGCLSEVVQELKRFLSSSKEFKDFVITSSIYPAVILFVTFSMIILLFTFFIPKFSKLFKDAGKELPFLTQAMLDIGNFMKTVWWLWPLLILLLIFLVRKSATNAALKNGKTECC